MWTNSHDWIWMNAHSQLWKLEAWSMLETDCTMETVWGEFVWVSCYCCNKLPQTWWIKIVLRSSGGQKSVTKVSVSLTTSQSSGVESSLVPSTFGGSRNSLACGYLTLVSTAIFVWPSSLSLTLVPEFRAHPDNPGWDHLEILNSAISAKDPFPK